MNQIFQKANVRIFRFMGAHVYLNLFFLIFFLLMPFQYAIVLLLSILVHEMAHVWAATNKGYPVYSINVNVIGGFASMRRINNRHQVFVSLAGPISNFILAGLGFLLNMYYPNMFFQALYVVNMFLGIFNILPIYPMDGGMALKSWLISNSRRLNKSSSEINLYVARISILFSIGVILYGLVNGYIFMILFGCYFIYLNGKSVQSPGGNRGGNVRRNVRRVVNRRRY